MFLYNKTGECARIEKDIRNPRRDLINIGKLCLNKKFDNLFQYNEMQDYEHQYNKILDKQKLKDEFDMMYMLNLYYDFNINLISYTNPFSIKSEHIGYYVITRDAAQAYAKTYRVYLF